MSAVRENRQDSRLQGDTQNLDIRQVTQKTIELRLGRVILGEYLLVLCFHFIALLLCIVDLACHALYLEIACRYPWGWINDMFSIRGAIGTFPLPPRLSA